MKQALIFRDEQQRADAAERELHAQNAIKQQREALDAERREAEKATADERAALAAERRHAAQEVQRAQTAADERRRECELRESLAAEKLAMAERQQAFAEALAESVRGLRKQTEGEVQRLSAWRSQLDSEHAAVERHERVVRQREDALRSFVQPFHFEDDHEADAPGDQVSDSGACSSRGTAAAGGQRAAGGVTFDSGDSQCH
jgi:hypothetical protein